MGRDNFPVTPAHSNEGIPSGQLIVEEKSRRGCACFLILLALVGGVVIYAQLVMDPVTLNLMLITVNNPGVKEYAIGNLAREGDLRAVDALKKELHHPNTGVRCRAAWALGEIGSHDGIDPLRKVLKHGMDGELSYYAVRSLLKIASRCPDGAPRGEKCMDDTAAVEVAEICLHGCMMSHVDYIICDSLFDDDVNLRIIAAQILVSVATENVRYIMEAAREDEDERVRTAVDMALAGLGPPPSTPPEYVFPEDIYPLLEEEYFPRLPLDVE